MMVQTAIGLCALIWADTYPICAPGQDLVQEVRVVACPAEEGPPAIRVEKRLIGGGEEGPWFPPYAPPPEEVAIP